MDVCQSELIAAHFEKAFKLLNNVAGIRYLFRK